MRGTPPSPSDEARRAAMAAIVNAHRAKYGGPDTDRPAELEALAEAGEIQVADQSDPQADPKRRETRGLVEEQRERSLGPKLDSLLAVEGKTAAMLEDRRLENQNAATVAQRRAGGSIDRVCTGMNRERNALRRERRIEASITRIRMRRVPLLCQGVRPRARESRPRTRARRASARGKTRAGPGDPPPEPSHAVEPEKWLRFFFPLVSYGDFHALTARRSGPERMAVVLRPSRPTYGPRWPRANTDGSIRSGSGERVPRSRPPVCRPWVAGFPLLRKDAADPETRFKDAVTSDSGLIEGWWRSHRDANVGVATGRGSGLLVLDVDGDAGADALHALEREHGELPRTASVKTPGGGSHYYFRHPAEPIRGSAGKLGPGLDIRADDGYVIAPPSRGQNGRRYEG